MAKYAGELRFVLDDDREVEYNESTDLTFKLYMDDTTDELLPILDYVDRCKQFALAMGFHPHSVAEAFGEEI